MKKSAHASATGSDYGEMPRNGPLGRPLGPLKTSSATRRGVPQGFSTRCALSGPCGFAGLPEPGTVAEARLSKVEIRALSRAAGLPTWDKPQQPCLASRIPYGTEVTRERLEQLARAEMALRTLGLREFRVRFHGEIARIEVADAELSRLIAVRAEAARALREAGFRFASVDLEPFRSGRLNEAAGLVPLRSS